MCPTPIGRIQTRVATLILPALLAAVASLVDGRADWLVLVGLLLLLGVALDAAVYSWLLRHQPPWITGVLAIAEGALLLVLAGAVDLYLTAAQVLVTYAIVWVVSVATKIAVLPIVSLTYLESGGELRRIEWSVPPAQASVPVIASPREAAAGPGPVIEAVSGAHATPLERKPGPSGVRAVPGRRT